MATDENEPESGTDGRGAGHDPATEHHEVRQPAAADGLAHRLEDRRKALATQDLVGQAKGILMERHGIGSEVAGRILVEASTGRHEHGEQIVATLVIAGTLRPEPDG